VALAAKDVVLKVSGAANAVTDEAMSSLGGGRYQVTSTSRRRWDPTAAITIEDGGTPVSATLYTFDYCFGIVTFSGYTPSGAVTVTGSYFTMLALPEARAYSIKVSAALADKTTFDSSGWRQFGQLLLQGEGDFEILANPLDDLDTGTGGTQSLVSYLTGATAKMLEVNRGGNYFVAFVLFESLDDKASLEDLLTTSMMWMLSAQGRGAAASFGT